MSKGHYPGGSTVFGEGVILKAKGRSGGLGSDKTAIIAARRKIEKKHKKVIDERIAANVKAAKKLYKLWGYDTPPPSKKRENQKTDRKGRNLKRGKTSRPMKPKPQTMEQAVSNRKYRAQQCNLASALMDAFNQKT